MFSVLDARVLLLVSTSSYRAGAFLDAARRLGVPLVVGSDRRQALADLNPEGQWTLDFADPDGATAEILRRSAAADANARRNGSVAAARQDARIGAVIAADDEGTLIASMAAHALGLRHAAVSAVEAARTKLGTREALRRAGLPGPVFRLVSIEDDPGSIAETIEFPCVIKPLHLSASRGVARADDRAGFIAAFRRLASLLARPEVPGLATRSSGPSDGRDPSWVKRHLLVEDYLPGIEVAVEGLLSAGRLRVLALFDKPDPLEGPFFEETLYVTPSRLEADRQRAIVSCVELAAGALGLDEGPVHAEVRLEGLQARLIEIAPRSIGGLCSRTLQFTGGASLEELLLMHALGIDTESIDLLPGAAGVLMIPIPGTGTLRRVGGLDDARGVPEIEDVRITIPIGGPVVPLPEGTRYLGFIFARGGTAAGVEAALRAALGRLSIEIESGSETGRAEGLLCGGAPGTKTPPTEGTPTW